MLVYCKICRKKIDRDSAYKVVGKNGNNYYCNKEEYLEKERATAEYRYIFKKYSDILSADSSKISLIVSETKKIIEEFGSTEVYNYLSNNEKLIKDTVYYKKNNGENFNNFYSLIKYVSGIIKNGINDNKNKKNNIPKTFVIKDVDVSIVNNIDSGFRKRGRRSLDEIEEEYDGDK